MAEDCICVPPPSFLLIVCRRCTAMPGDECRSPNGSRVQGGAHMIRVNDDRRQRGLINENPTEQR